MLKNEKIYLDKERCVLYDRNIAKTRLKAIKKRICEIWREEGRAYGAFSENRRSV